MNELKTLLKELRLGRFTIHDFFLLVCPHVCDENAQEICDSIPTDDTIEFRRLVAYQEPTGEFCEIGAGDGPQSIDSRFIKGLECLRKFLDSSGTLQFGDHLLMERERLRSLVGKLERRPEMVSNETKSTAIEQLKYLELLIDFYDPKVLREQMTG